MPTREFEAYLGEIPDGFVRSYRELLAQQRVQVSDSDTPLQLLNKHFQACFAAVPPPSPRPTARRLLAAGLKGLRP